MTACAAICAPAPPLSSPRSTIGWRPSTNSRPAATTASTRAGGNMAAVTALRVRDEGGPELCAQLLLYPVTDYHTPGTPSYAENAEGYGLTRDTMRWFWAHYLGDASEGVHPYAAPLRAADLASLPSALVITAEYDPLRDEGEHYADRLRAAGVATALTRYDGVNHGFMFRAVDVEKFITLVDHLGIDRLMIADKDQAGYGSATRRRRTASAHGAGATLDV